MKANIIIRAYNAEATIERALKSALLQSLPRNDLEIIVVDDGSTDGTSGILVRYQNEAGIRIVAQKNAGAIAAANRGLQEARSEFVSFLDADDYLEPDFLTELISTLEGDAGLQFAYCDYWEEKDGVRTLISPRSSFEGLLGNMLFRKAALDTEGGFREFLFADYELLLRTLGRWRSSYVAKPLFTYTRHSGSISANAENVAKAVEDLKHAYPEHTAAIDSIRTYD